MVLELVFDGSITTCMLFVCGRIQIHATTQVPQAMQIAYIDKGKATMQKHYLCTGRS